MTKHRTCVLATWFIAAAIIGPGKSLGNEPAPKPADGVNADPVFRKVLRRPNDDGSKAYRIPALATTPKGTLLAAYDIRYGGGADLPADIDVGLLRSTDNGETWSAQQRILDFDKNEPNAQGNGVSDPCILVDAKTGHVFVAALWSHGKRGWNGSGPGLKPEETGQFVITKSTDDGLTWSKPRSITSQVKDSQWRLCFQGPGAGIQTRDGTLIFPAQFRTATGVAHSCFIFSRDGGEHWTISPPAIPESPPTSESQIVELASGDLLLSMRNESKSGKRAWARWSWSEADANEPKPRLGKWSAPWFTVPDPTCMASLIRHPHGELLFANPNSEKQRVALTIRASIDEGKTWSAGRLLDPRPAAYSCLTILKNGQIGILYESGDQGAAETLTFARFSLEWVLAGNAAKPAAMRAHPAAKAGLTLAEVFQDHMVLQRELPLPVWGHAGAGAEVVVSFGQQRKQTTATRAGLWRLNLEPLTANADPTTMLVTSGKEEITRRDILVGEVWVCAGQSNMEWPLEREQTAAEALPAATAGQLRLLNWRSATKYVSGKPFAESQRTELTPEKFFRGQWAVCTPQSAADFSAVGYFFGQELRRKLQVPVGLVNLAVGGSPTEAWIRREALAADDELKVLVQGNWLTNEKLGPWCRERGRQNLGSTLTVADASVSDLGPPHPFQPTFLWQAGMARLIPYGIRGVVWYQGESNSLESWRVSQHERLFPLLVRDWRAQWGQGEFPFLYCQLSSIGTEGGYKSEKWPEFRDSQRRLLDVIPNAGMAVTSDLGHPTDVHPRNKRDVGQRLALWALAKTYGQQVNYSGPLPLTAKRRGPTVVVQFDHADGGLCTVSGKTVLGFEIAPDDGQWREAKATIKESAVVVASEQVTAPASVRYAWQPYSQGNLINAAGLPASTFTMPVSTK